MKKIIFGTLFMITVFAGRAQSNGEQLASVMAQRMKDTLSLSDSQKVQLYNVNMSLHNQKVLKWQLYSNQPDSLSYHLQRIENTRDSLYIPVLTEEQYNLYISKKKNLVRTN